MEETLTILKGVQT